MIDTVYSGEDIIALILRAKFSSEGTKFLTPKSFSQQLGFIKKEKDEKIKLHKHNMVKRNVINTQEVLFIKAGKVKVNLYSKDREFIRSVMLNPGDTILLASGCHGFDFLEKTEMIEVKQGPYLENQDKTIFDE